MFDLDPRVWEELFQPLYKDTHNLFVIVKDGVGGSFRQDVAWRL